MRYVQENSMSVECPLKNIERTEKRREPILHKFHANWFAVLLIEMARAGNSFLSVRFDSIRRAEKERSIDRSLELILSSPFESSRKKILDDSYDYFKALISHKA